MKKAGAALVWICLVSSLAAARQTPPAGNDALEIKAEEAQISRQVVRIVIAARILPESQATEATLRAVAGYFLDQAERRYELSIGDIKPGTLVFEPAPSTKTIARGDTYRYALTYSSTGDVGLDSRIYKVFLFLDGAMEPVDVPVAAPKP